MTEEMTPVEELDEAVRKYALDIGITGEVSSWVLGLQTSHLTSNPALLPLGFSSTYSMGLATSPETAIGLCRIVERRITDALFTGPPSAIG